MNVDVTKIPNLTTNGFIKTSGSDGSLSVDSGSYITGVTHDYSMSGGGTTASPIGLITPPIEKTASFTLALTDLDAMLGCNHATVAIVVTVPPNSSMAVPIGKSVYIRRKGAAAVSIAAGAGVTINSENNYLNLNAQYSVAQLLKVDTDTWALFGSLKA